MDNAPELTSEAIQMLVSSITQRGTAPLTELEGERLLNAITRAQSNVPTGIRSAPDQGLRRPGTPG